MIYGSVCSGIEAATQAWHPLGWEPAFFSEIERFPSAVLAHHYPDVPNLGDMTKFKEWPDVSIDLLVGGTPCQSFSVAGLRKGLADPRGNLALTYLAIAERYRPRWIVWENVPGVLSSGEGRDFGSFLGALGQLGYGFAYRVLDAQYVRTRGYARAVPQRRRRVFVVGHLGDWRRAAAVLFDRESMSGNPAPRRETRKDVAHTLSARPSGGGGLGTDFDLDGGLTAVCENWPADTAPTLNAHFGDKMGLENQHALNGAGLFVPVAFSCKDHGADAGEISPTLRSMNHDGSHANAGGQLAVAFNARQDPDSWEHHTGPLDTHAGTQAVGFDMRGRDGGAMLEGPHETANIRAASGGSSRSYIAQPWAVRRLTPKECERLQAFPDDFTKIPYRGKPADQCPAGPRYKALGNSMAVNVMAWIGERIELIDQIDKAQENAA
jgi:DNA (cytosine-5)-methyltransferase 1